MTIWFISDTYFGNASVIDEHRRPFGNVDEMDDLIYSNWNQNVGFDDLVYHLGDVSCLRHEHTKKLIQSLNGTKILIRGDNDQEPERMLDLGFVAVEESCFIQLNGYDCYVGHEPFPVGAPDVWMLHGHVHKKWKVLPATRKICLSVDNWDFAPVSEKQIVAIMQGQFEFKPKLVVKKTNAKKTK